MPYIEQTFSTGQTLEASDLNTMSKGIVSKQDKLVSGTNIKTLNGISLLGTGDISIEDGTLVDNSIIIYTDDASKWVQQQMSLTGSISLPGTAGYDRSQIMYYTKFTNPVYLIPNGDIMYALITYDASGNFKARSSWYTEGDGVQCLSDENPFNVLVATGEASSLSIETVLSRFKLQNIDPDSIEEAISQEAFTKMQAKIDYLNYIQCCDIADKLVHFSCDDTYACLYDLIQNGSSYNSIFDNSFFASLKTCHDETGACFTLNTFNTETTVPDYDISNVPSTFQSEFQANKSWLRFAFHAEDEKTYCKNITAEAALTSYNKFVSAIYKLTGDYECIDTITRLGFFSSNLENALVFKNAEHGIIGLLSADDTRTSYYLTNEQSEIARLKGKYYDLDNELIFIKTLNRSNATAKAELENNPMYRKNAEFFWHEYENAASVKPWVTTMAQWCNEQGYIHGFPSDLYKPVV